MKIIPLILITAICSQAGIWIEGESSTDSTTNQHGWYYGQSRKDLLSGADFIAHYGEKPAEANYTFQAENSGPQTLWVRANPTGTRLSYSLNSGPWELAVLKSKSIDMRSLAPGKKVDIRFLAWANLGKLNLKKGENKISFRFEGSKNNGEHHGALDIFYFTTENFRPSGALNPEEIAARDLKLMKDYPDWFSWDPPQDAFKASPIDLRKLNESYAGEKGGISVKGADFVYRNTGEPVKFWAVNGPGANLDDESIAYSARFLAKRGVNMVRLHGSIFDRKTGELNPKRVDYIHRVVAAMKKEGIYSHLSIYFPLWFTPESAPGWRADYNGEKKTFAALFFEPEFQKLYRSWWRTLLTSPGPDGEILANNPAVFGAEVINEDSLFFWTFKKGNIPPQQWSHLENRFAKWAAARYGSIALAHEAWGKKQRRKGDSEDSLTIGSLSEILDNKNLRHQNTAEFLYDLQRNFYDESISFLKDDLGFTGLVTASNWHTASPEFFGPLEKFSYSGGDFIDRHGYFGNFHTGDRSNYSVAEGHIIAHRSALKFDPKKPGEPPSYSHPVTDTEINEKPSMISETTWTRPNKYRGEAPLYYAAYASLQGTDAIAHFATRQVQWAHTTGFLADPWTLMAPTQMGQFPAAALIYRKGYLKEGELLADYTLSLEDAFALKGNPLGREASLDALRQTEETDRNSALTTAVTPLIHFAGRTALKIGDQSSEAISPLGDLIDPSKKTVRASSKELFLDYGKGYLAIRFPMGPRGDRRSSESRHDIFSSSGNFFANANRPNYCDLTRWKEVN